MKTFLCIFVSLFLIADASCETRVFQCAKALGTIMIDGDLTETAWLKASKLTDFYQLGEEEKADFQTIAAITYDDKFLYLGAIMRKGLGEKMRMKSLWNGDDIELFVMPDLDVERYYQVAVNPENRYSGSKGVGKHADSQWNSDIRYAGKILDCAWTIEVAIPLQWLNAKPVVGQSWKFNICRGDPVHGLSTWAPLKGSFHQPERFASMRFADSTDKIPSPDVAPLLKRVKMELRNMEERLININKPENTVLIQKSLQKDKRLMEKTQSSMVLCGVFANYQKFWLCEELLKKFDNSLKWRIKIIELFE